MELSDVVIVLTTVPAGADISALSRVLVDERLAACVSATGELRSVYRWEGRVTEDAERQLIIKTTAGRLEDLRARLTSLHPYTLPEFLVLPTADSPAAYLDWVRHAVHD